MKQGKEERVANLKKRRAEIDAELNRLEAKDRAKKRKEDTRRKILLGAVVLQEVEADPQGSIAKWARRLLEERLTKPRDRALFNLDKP